MWRSGGDLDFADWLRASRACLNISRERLAAVAGISHQTIYRAERALPTLAMTRRVITQAIQALERSRRGTHDRR